MRSITYLQPILPILVAALFIGVLRRSRTSVAGGMIALLLLTSLPVAELVMRTLEQKYPPREYPAGEAQAIVVLGGGIYKHDDGQPENIPAQDTYVRARYAARLYRAWRPLPVVVSGGDAGTQIRVSIAGVAAQVIREAGVPASMIWTEARSQSTYDSARFCAELLQSKGIRRIVLVTEAYHMRRAEAAFARAGLTVNPAACAYRGHLSAGGVERLLPSATAIVWNELAAHEWLGLLWYRWSGKA
jgi:uncharacterized SAM-binding protein YcdF (DUF218 family)